MELATAEAVEMRLLRADDFGFCDVVLLLVVVVVMVDSALVVMVVDGALEVVVVVVDGALEVVVNGVLGVVVDGVLVLVVVMAAFAVVVIVASVVDVVARLISILAPAPAVTVTVTVTVEVETGNLVEQNCWAAELPATAVATAPTSPVQEAAETESEKDEKRMLYNSSLWDESILVSRQYLRQRWKLGQTKSRNTRKYKYQQHMRCLNDLFPRSKLGVKNKEII